VANVFANAGKAITTNRLIGSGTQPGYGAWGTGAGTSAVTDTTLFTEDTTSGYARAATTNTRTTTTVTNDTLQMVWTNTCLAGGGLTITNAGVFDASTTGNLFIKGDFTGVVLANNDSIQFTGSLAYS
jgi:hypothetical protein